MRSLLARRRGDDHGTGVVRRSRARLWIAQRPNEGVISPIIFRPISSAIRRRGTKSFERCFKARWEHPWTYPNQHRKLFNGSAEAYTRLWTRKLRAAQAAGIKVGVIAVLHQGSLEAGPEKFYRYFTEELGLTDFQVNTPFPGGPAG